MERELVWVLVLIPALIVTGGVLIIMWGIRHATRLAELQHQERLAMIERGMTPPDDAGRDRLQRSYGFKMSFGIMLSGLGLGLAMLIAFAGGAIDIGVGVGGAVLMVGLAFVVSAVVTERQGPPPAT